MTNDRTYNGWTNYATWRVHLEMFDGMSADDYGTRSTYDLSLSLREQAEEHIVDSTSDGLARDYALAFLSEVNWREIAVHLIDAAEEIEEEDAA
jgi:hypothetical protein